MFLRHLRVKHLKLLRDVTFDFEHEGTLRKWTVVIGKNGTGKTSLLQAIALAAAGSLQVNSLTRDSYGHLRDRRGDEPLEIEAEFQFAEGARQTWLHPGDAWPLLSPLRLASRVWLADEEQTVRATSSYVGLASKEDPLDWARSRNRPRWFVAGYGVARFLPEVGRTPQLQLPAIDRLRTLFDPMAGLTSTGFSTLFGEGEKARRFHRVLKSALRVATESLLPGIEGMELRGRGGIVRPGDLLERDRFTQRVGRSNLKLPLVALAHGYQSTMAWIADLVGHILLEAETEVEPEQMEGLVLIDEIDLYLHPTWQATLIPALRSTFPALQFIVTTHSPVVLSGVAPHEVIRLASWGDDGDVVEIAHDPVSGELARAAELQGGSYRPEARMMTGSEIFREYFGLESEQFGALEIEPPRLEDTKKTQRKAIPWCPW